MADEKVVQLPVAEGQAQPPAEPKVVVKVQIIVFDTGQVTWSAEPGCSRFELIGLLVSMLKGLGA